MTNDSGSSNPATTLTRLRPWFLISCVFLALIYCLFPSVAGALAIGDRDGPKIYFSDHHSILYMLAFESRFGEKPRVDIFYERPWFYGLPRKKRSIQPDRPHYQRSLGLPEWR